MIGIWRIRPKYLGEEDKHWRLPAVLKVKLRLSSHAEAARWYRARGQAIPSNCVVPMNKPLSLRLTGESRVSLHAWDAEYKKRAKQTGVFLVCVPVFCELREPPVIRRNDLRRIFGGIPATQTPREHDERDFRGLCRTAGIVMR